MWDNSLWYPQPIPHSLIPHPHQRVCFWNSLIRADNRLQGSATGDEAAGGGVVGATDSHHQPDDSAMQKPSEHSITSVSWVKWCPVEGEVEVLTSSTWACDFIWKQGLADVIGIRWGHTALGQALNPMTDVLMRRRKCGHKHTQGEFQVETEAEIGVMCLHAKELPR